MRDIGRGTRWAAMVVGVAVALLGAGCAKGPANPTVPASSRPSSPAKVVIVSPRNGEVFQRGIVPVRVRLTGGHIVPRTSLHITPTTGHLHQYLDGRLYSMNYRLADALRGVKPGLHQLRIEF